MQREEMKNIPNSIPGKKPIRTMFGNLKTQVWARKAFPILVNRAQNDQTITFKELAEDHFGVRGYMIFGPVCGIISATLYELEKEWSSGHIPRITNIVVRSDGNASRYVSNILTGDRDIPPEVSKYMEIQLKPIWEYQHWEVVKTALELKGKIHDIEVELAKARNAYYQFIR